MPRARVPSPDDMEMIPLPRVHPGRGRPRKEDVDDPRETAEGTIKAEKPKTLTKMSAGGAERYRLYVRALVASHGYPIPALAAAYGISEEEAEKNAVALHQEVISFSRSGISLQEMLEQHDLTTEARIAVLRDALFSPQAPVRLKAVEMLDEIDMTAKAKRIGNSWEEIVRQAKERASRAKKKR